MRVLLSGAEGNLGRHIIKNADFSVEKITRKSWNDLSSEESDCFIHAAYDLKNNYIQHPSTVLDSNVQSLAKALELCKKYSIKKFIFISSSAVYGNSQECLEEDQLCPISFNGFVKALGEQLVKDFCSHNKIDFLILRVFNTFGGDDHFSVISKMVKAKEENGEFLVVNNAEAFRDFVHVDDIAKIVCHYVKNDSRYQVLNIGTGQALQIKEALHLFEQIHGTLKTRSVVNEREVKYSQANILKLKSEVPFSFNTIENYIKSLKI